MVCGKIGSMKPTMLLLNRTARACLIGHVGTVVVFDIHATVDPDRLDELIERLFVWPLRVLIAPDDTEIRVIHPAITLPAFGDYRPPQGLTGAGTIEPVVEVITIEEQRLGDARVRCGYSEHSQRWYVAVD